MFCRMAWNTEDLPAGDTKGEGSVQCMRQIHMPTFTLWPCSVAEVHTRVQRVGAEVQLATALSRFLSVDAHNGQHRGRELTASYTAHSGSYQC
jgi:hypothetical protein